MSIRHRFRFAPAVNRLEDRETPAAGDLDPTFGTGGVVTALVSQRPVSFLPDGRFLALGSAGAQRFNPDGSVDPTFGTNGVGPIPQAVNPSVLTALPDGGAVVAGITGNLGSPLQFAVTRVTAAGAIDTSFGANGVALIGPTSPLYSLGSVVAQPDGKLMVVGGIARETFANGLTTRTGEIVVDRLTPTGQPDASFGQGGRATVPFPAGQSSYAAANAAAVQPDGRIVLGGFASATPAAVRLTSDGQLDPTFGSGGRVLVPVPQATFSSGFQAVNVQPDGRLLLASDSASATEQFGVAARLTAGGQPDPTYGTGGLATSPGLAYSPAANSFHTIRARVDSIGRAVFATVRSGRGNLFSNNQVFRLAADGAADAGFGTNGRVSIDDLPGLDVVGTAVTTQPDGSIVLGGGPQLIRLIGSNPPAGFVPAVRGTVTAGGPADGTAQVFNPANGTYAAAGTMGVYGGFAGNVRATTADVTGDGTPDYVAGAGPGGRPQVTVFDGKSGTTVADFPAFEATFTGGVFVATADLDGDGRAELVVTPDQGGSSRVVVLSVAPGGGVTQRASFFGIDDPNFRGGARAALGDVNADGTPDLAVAAGFLGGPRTALFDGKSLFTSQARLVGDFFAFPGEDAARLRNGAFVALGDLTGDGFADLVFGGGPGGAPRVFALSGALVSAGNVSGAQAGPVLNFFVAGNSTDRGGVRVAAADADGDGRADLVAGSGAGSPARVRVYLGRTVTSAAEPGAFQDLAPFGGAALADGVYVG